MKFFKYKNIPYVGYNNKIGLLGGSFNPPHIGHITIAETALKRLNLDQIWFLVTPGNPSKINNKLPSLSSRVNKLKNFIYNKHRIKITTCECLFKSFYSINIIKKLVNQYPYLKLVWIIGVDNIKNFHKWKKWRNIAKLLPIAIISRPGYIFSIISSIFTQAYEDYRFPEEKSDLFVMQSAPSWILLNIKLVYISSTYLRNKNILKNS